MTVALFVVTLFLCGVIASLLLSRARPLDLGQPRSIEAIPKGSRSAYVDLECDHGTVRIECDDERAAYLSDRFLYLASTLAPRPAVDAAKDG